MQWEGDLYVLYLQSSCMAESEDDLTEFWSSLRSLSNAVNLNCKANAIENVVCEALFDLPTFRSLQKNDLSSPNAWINKKVNVWSDYHYN